jgi:hypothetical protein
MTRRHAHPKRRDDLRLVVQGIVGFLVLLLICIAAPVLG